MLLLGIYGDILGAPKEKEAIHDNKYNPRNPEDLGNFTAFDDFGRLKDEVPDKWGIWIDKSIISNIKGIPTDDTAFRIIFLYRWIAEYASLGFPLNETNFYNWLNNDKLPKKYKNVLGVEHSYNKMRSQFLEMFKVALDNDVNNGIHFYSPTRPVFFGNFMYLELVSTRLNHTEEDVLIEFYNFSDLDKGIEKESGIGNTITALCTAILHQSLKKEGIGYKLVFDFLENTTIRLLELAKEFNFKEVDRIRDAMIWAINMGESLSSALKVYESLSKIYLTGENENKYGWKDEDGKLYAHHPLLMWIQLWSALSFYRDSPVESITITAAGYGDTDTVSSFLGSILGGLLGKDTLLNISINDIPLKDKIQTIHSNISFLFNTDLYDISNLLMEITEDSSVS